MKEFMKPEIKISKFICENIITVSGGGNEGGTDGGSVWQPTAASANSQPAQVNIDTITR